MCSQERSGGECCGGVGVGIVVGVVFEHHGHQVAGHPEELGQGGGLAFEDALAVLGVVLIVLIILVIFVRVFFFITFGPEGGISKIIS